MVGIKTDTKVVELTLKVEEARDEEVPVPLENQDTQETKRQIIKDKEKKEIPTEDPNLNKNTR